MPCMGNVWGMYTKTGCRLWRQLSPNGTEAYSDGNHNSQALSGDVYRAFATVGTMSLLLTPLVTDIQWPHWLKIGPAPKNVTEKALTACRVTTSHARSIMHGADQGLTTRGLSLRLIG